VLCSAGFHRATPRAVHLSNCLLCLPGTYSLDVGRSTNCPACPEDHYCRTSTLKQACPAHTSALKGSFSILNCACDRGFNCSYHRQIQAVVTLNATHSDFNDDVGGIRTAFLQALAAAGGVPDRHVAINGVADTPVAHAARRLLSAGPDQPEGPDSPDHGSGPPAGPEAPAPQSMFDDEPEDEGDVPDDISDPPNATDPGRLSMFDDEPEDEGDDPCVDAPCLDANETVAAIEAVAVNETEAVAVNETVTVAVIEAVAVNETDTHAVNETETETVGGRRLLAATPSPQRVPKRPRSPGGIRVLASVHGSGRLHGLERHLARHDPTLHISHRWEPTHKVHARRA
jgi:hypothetical protein